MDRKDISLIERIKVDGHTFHDEHVEPTYINFFFGKNGAGKSTLAEAFEGDRKALIPATGVNLDDYTILVYNQAFIRENFRTYGDLKGVFTLSKENADKREEIDKKIEEKSKKKIFYKDAKYIITNCTKSNQIINYFNIDPNYIEHTKNEIEKEIKKK